MKFAYYPLDGQPDRLCDLLAAGIADEYLRRDPETRINCSVAGGLGALFITGEILSSADFDIVHLVKRQLASSGIYDGLEIFPALEPVSSELVGQVRQLCQEPIMAMGYATNESASFLPEAVDSARQIAGLLMDKKVNDQDWFWLGGAGWVAVSDDFINIRIDHGNVPLGSIRAQVENVVKELNLSERRIIKVNELGALTKIGLDICAGHSGAALNPYGSSLPGVPNPAGKSWHDANVLGPWLARYVALKLLKSSGVQAALVKLFYQPGEIEPSAIWARDEKGHDLSRYCKDIDFNLEHRRAEWLQNGLMLEAVRNQGVGRASLPWEGI